MKKNLNEKTLKKIYEKSKSGMLKKVWSCFVL